MTTYTLEYVRSVCHDAADRDLPSLLKAIVVVERYIQEMPFDADQQAVTAMRELSEYLSDAFDQASAGGHE